MINISVVIPVYNTAQYIEKCIKSLLMQNYPKHEYEVIMVDNGSTDGSVDIIKRHPGIRLLVEPKKGSYAARNKGIAHARGKIIAFTDSDCVPDADWLNRMDDGVNTPGVKVVLGRRIYPSGSPAFHKLADYEQEKTDYIYHSNIRELYLGYTNNMAVSADMFNEFGLFIERDRGADTLFVHKLLDRYPCSSILYLPEMRVKHLEIEFLRDFYKKMNIYGSSKRRSDHLASMRSLNFREKLQVYNRVVQSHKYSFINSLHLLLLLIFGVFFFKLGYHNINIK
jgi:glycosyltransferase involved in cell wall biosynthesis